jgi:predicted permease
MFGALRRLTRTPLFAAGFALTLGLGLGAAVSILQVVDALHLRALPFPDADRLVRVYLVPAAGTPRLSLRAEPFLALHERTGDLFAGFAGQRLTSRTLETGQAPVSVDALGVTADWGAVLGVRPQLGRLFTAEEAALGESSDAVLISDGTWRRLLGADPAAVGRKLRLDGRAVTVVGVLPRGYSFPYSADVWHPVRAEDRSASPWAFNAPARLRPGRTVAEINAALAAMAPELTRLLPDQFRELRPLAVPLRETMLDGEERIAAAALVAVAILLALVTVNLGALLHARWTRGRRELAVRQALGASAARLTRHLLGETVLLGVAGLGVAFGLARLARPFLVRQLPDRLAEVVPSVATSPAVAAATLVTAAALVALAAGGSAWSLARGTSFTLLRGDRGAGGGRRERAASRAVVALQVALTLTLVTATLAMVGDLRGRADVDLGYDAERLTLFSLSLTAGDDADPERRTAFIERVVERLAALPGVEAAAATQLFPSPYGAHLARPARADAADPGAEVPLAHHRLVSPGYAATLGLDLVRGRWFDARDGGEHARVAVLSQRLADRLFPEGDPLGRQVLNARNAEPMPAEVIGVVADLHEFVDVDSAWYRPLAAHAEEAGAHATFVVRVAPGAEPPGQAALRAVGDAVDPTVAIYDLETPRSLLAASLAARRDAAAAASFFAGFGLLLAALGLFALVADGVARRRRELGIRLALGASNRRLFRRLVGESLRLAAAGSALGVTGGFAVLAVMARQLDAPALAAARWPLVAATMLAFVAVALAAALAARRALHLDPAAVLRDD